MSLWRWCLASSVVPLKNFNSRSLAGPFLQHSLGTHISLGCPPLGGSGAALLSTGHPAGRVGVCLECVAGLPWGALAHAWGWRMLRAPRWWWWCATCLGNGWAPWRGRRAIPHMMLHINLTKLSCLGVTFRCFPGEVFSACPTGRRSRGRPRRAGGTMSLDIPKSFLGFPGRSESFCEEGRLGISA